MITPEALTGVGQVVAAGESTKAALEACPVGGIIYFAQNFETLGIKKLISTSYATDRKKQQYEQYHQMTLFELNFPTI